MSGFPSEKKLRAHIVAPVFDEQQVNALMAILGARSPAAYAIFFAEASRRVDRMRAKILGNDRNAIGSEAHALKSAAATFGCTRISEVATTIEARSDVLSVGALRRHVADIERQLSLAQRFLGPRLTSATTRAVPGRALALS